MTTNEDALIKIQSVIEDCSSQVKWSGLNAIKWLHTSRTLKEINPELSAFAAICAEEEAAASLIHSLKALKYPGAKRIKFTSHPHKHAVYVFIKVLIDWFSEQQSNEAWPFRSAVFNVKKEGRRLAIHLALPLKTQPIAANPYPPLNVDIKGASNLEEMLVKHVEVVLSASRVEDVRKLIEKSAGYRNELLYADSKGLPKFDANIEGFIEHHMEKVSLLLMAVGLIDPWGKHPHAPLVSTCVSLLLTFMERTTNGNE
ncbi:hypothetical protein C4K00_2937 [Pseudomonas synxantha]|uniref:hypothetical protein n=1 Tax=Pseudomonas synxantha TaxID=47883 RepID=UPI000F578597|nr:hypothetical protein [Pseudomonas synxantha]AZE73165.1 hypothetical protein C4K00_2937 [Pseudomonas synxantha]